MFNGHDSNIERSQQVASTSDVTVTSTTNAAVPGLSLSIQSTGTSDVWIVDLDPDVQVTTNVAGGGSITLNIVELLVDGVAQTAQIVTQITSDGTFRYSGHKKYRLTGLSAGSHTLTARTRNTLSSTSATIRTSHTRLTAVHGD